jgi:hypothetical protein
VRVRRIVVAAVVGGLAACASGGPRVYGPTADLAPKVAPQQGERVPQHLTVQLGKPANVAVFLVMPGRGSQLLFPSDSAQSGFIEAGSHLVETSYRRAALSDSGRLIRQPNPGSRTQPQQGRGRNPRDTFPTFGFNQRGYLLIYASQEPLPYNILANRVSGISIPIEDNDALNTVTKLIRAETRTTGPWAAFATEYPP